VEADAKTVADWQPKGGEPGKVAAAAEANEIVVAAEIIEGIDDKIGIVGNRRGDPHAQKILELNPEAISQYVGISNYDEINRRLGLGYEDGIGWIIVLFLGPAIVKSRHRGAPDASGAHHNLNARLQV
jgi:hypothetical protein